MATDDLKELGTGEVHCVEFDVRSPSVTVHKDGESPSCFSKYKVTQRYALQLIGMAGSRSLIGKRVMISMLGEEVVLAELPPEFMPEPPATIAHLRKEWLDMKTRLNSLSDYETMQRNIVTATNERDSLSAQCFNLRNTVTGLTRDNDALHRAAEREAEAVASNAAECHRLSDLLREQDRLRTALENHNTNLRDDVARLNRAIADIRVALP